MMLLARVRRKDWCYGQIFILTYVFKFICVCVCVHMHIYLGLIGGLGVFDCMSLAGLGIEKGRED